MDTKNLLDTHKRHPYTHCIEKEREQREKDRRKEYQEFSR
jgi:hypothetical protein